MTKKRQFAVKEARSIGVQLKIDWSQIEMEQFQRGLEVELEHGTTDSETNVTGDDMMLTGKIAWTHLKESEVITPDWITWMRRQKSRSRIRLCTRLIQG